MTESKLGNLPLNQVISIKETAFNGGDTIDTYAFHLSEGGNLNLALTDVSFKDKFHISLYEDIDGNGKFSPSIDKYIQDSTTAYVLNDDFGNFFNGDQSIYMSNLKPGNYLAFVDLDSSNDGSASYKFLASNTTRESNILAATVDFGVYLGTPSGFSNHHLNDKHTSDIYKLNVPTGKHVKVTLTESTGQAQMNDIKDVGQDHIDTNYQEIVNHSTGSGQTKTLTIDSGEHYLQVFGVPGQDLATQVQFSSFF